MPNLDGLSMCKKLISDNIENEAPILMVTTEASPKLKKEGIDAGVYKWILKPVSDKKFLTMVEKIYHAIDLQKSSQATSKKILENQSFL